MQVITACTGLEKLSITFNVAPICVSVMRALKTKAPSSLKRLELDVSLVQGLKGLGKAPAVTLPLSVREVMILGNTDLEDPILSMVERSPLVERVECMGGLTTAGFSFADYPNTRPKITSITPRSGLPVASLQSIRQLNLGFGVSGGDDFWTSISAFPLLEDLKVGYVVSNTLARINQLSLHLNRLVVDGLWLYGELTEEQHRNGAASLLAKVSLVVIEMTYGGYGDATDEEANSWLSLPNVYNMENNEHGRKIVWDDHGIWPSLLAE